jgi:hypothetical protein
MLAMAQSWILLADQAERNSHLKAAPTGLTGHGNRTRPYSIFLAKRLTGEMLLNVPAEVPRQDVLAEGRRRGRPECRAP